GGESAERDAVETYANADAERIGDDLAVAGRGAHVSVVWSRICLTGPDCAAKARWAPSVAHPESCSQFRRTSSVGETHHTARSKESARTVSMHACNRREPCPIR